MTTVAILLLLLWLLDGLRLQARLRAIPVLEDGAPEDPRFVVIAAPGIEVSEAVVSAAAEHARRDHGLVALRRESLEGVAVATSNDGELMSGALQSQLWNHIVRDEDANDIRFLCVTYTPSRKAVFLGLCPGIVIAHTHLRIEPGVSQIQRPGTTLVTVAHHRDSLALNRSQIYVFLIVKLCHATPTRTHLVERLYTGQDFKVDSS